MMTTGTVAISGQHYHHRRCRHSIRHQVQLLHHCHHRNSCNPSCVTASHPGATPVFNATRLLSGAQTTCARTISNL
jgi:hypothetical protein